MTKEELYGKFIKLAPYKTEIDKKFNLIIGNALNEYQKQLSKVEVPDIDTLKNDVEDIIKEINEIIKSSYCGKHSNAYTQSADFL